MKSAINFMLYSYFKITTDSSKEIIMSKIVDRAYDDAVMQGAYNAILPSEFKEQSAKTRKTVSERIIPIFLYDVFENNFDPVGVMDAVKGTYDKEVNGCSEYFSFGNAQKWVNMTIKYVLIVNKLLCLVDDGHEFCKVGKAFEKKKAQFDLPVDSYILEKMWDMKEMDIPIRTEERKGKYSSDKIKPWSQWCREDYMAFRESLHKAIECPIEWEGPAWIEIAEKRSDQ